MRIMKSSMLLMFPWRALNELAPVNLISNANGDRTLRNAKVIGLVSDHSCDPCDSEICGEIPSREFALAYASKAADTPEPVMIDSVLRGYP